GGGTRSLGTGDVAVGRGRRPAYAPGGWRQHGPRRTATGPPLHRAAGAGHVVHHDGHRPVAHLQQRCRSAGPRARRPRIGARADLVATINHPSPRTLVRGPFSCAMTAALPSPTPGQRPQIAAGFELANQLLRQSQLRAAAAALEPCCEADPANLTYRRLLHAVRRQLTPVGASVGFLTRLRRWRAA